MFTNISIWCPTTTSKDFQMDSTHRSTEEVSVRIVNSPLPTLLLLTDRGQTKVQRRSKSQEVVPSGLTGVKNIPVVEMDDWKGSLSLSLVFWRRQERSLQWKWHKINKVSRSGLSWILSWYVVTLIVAVSIHPPVKPKIDVVNKTLY